VSAEGREQPKIEPQVEETPAAVADAPDTTTPKTMHEDPSKLDQSGDESAENTSASSKRSSSKPSTSRAAKPSGPRTTEKKDES
jgi:hypothetical protein